MVLFFDYYMSKIVEKWEKFWLNRDNNFNIPTPFLLEFAKKYYKKNKNKYLNAIDIASGDGRYAVPLSKIGYIVDLIEISNAGVIRAKENVKKEKAKVTIEQNDFLKICLEKRQYDIVLCSGLLEEINKKYHQKAVAGFMNWTKPGGINIVKYCLEISGRGKLVDDNKISKIYRKAGWKIIFEEEEVGMHRSIANINRENDIRAGTLVAEKNS